MPNLCLDHIVLAVPNLKDAIDFFQRSLGITPLIGGKHIGFGTHNALVGLGKPKDNIYLELLAIDPEAEIYPEIYPMGLSVDIQEPYFASWCIRCSSETDIEKTMHTMQAIGESYDHGSVRNMQRTTLSGKVLSWQIANHSKQVLMSKGQIPFLIKWDDLNQHPTLQLQQQNFISCSLNFSGPNCKEIERNLKTLDCLLPSFLTFSSSSEIMINFELYGQCNIVTFGCLKDIEIASLRPRL